MRIASRRHVTSSSTSPTRLGLPPSTMRISRMLLENVVELSDHEIGRRETPQFQSSSGNGIHSRAVLAIVTAKPHPGYGRPSYGGGGGQWGSQSSSFQQNQMSGGFQNGGGFGGGMGGGSGGYGYGK
ncbi:Heterogeneous nuclear ribonucleoprotein A1 [Caenorhabditis elegans]|uniref:Heterogeneous nuclear ribonucleoprotein A1 n=1 Tax=Caenorhabditis elegans TaxID=6239 RepID=Q965K8_CAEEL|nr:Heterogeneous nuclear ribonucleoprotein A1 [Caenorhabditis elegans]CCD69571.2 Heterogeneous nuclear ribonucleoprotein A1 [Caenorhabditis elegans]|eukprot:NP_503449.2 Uncharacterized protein CELE_F16B4.5 [Caenorhabditis elegans]